MVHTLCSLAFVAALLITSANAQSNCDRFYAVNSGDTCDSIAAAQHVPTFQLQTVNSDIIDAACDNLSPGEVLCLGLQGQDCETTYVVQSGDTCVAISSAHNIPLSTLLANNANINSDCTNIGVGEVLCVADQVIGAPGPSSTVATSSSILTQTVPESSTPPTSDPFPCLTGPVDSSVTVPFSCFPFTSSVSSVVSSATVPVFSQPSLSSSHPVGPSTSVQVSTVFATSSAVTI